MENVLFKQPAVSGEINQFLPVELFTDRQSAADARNQKLKTQLTGAVINPVYAVVSPDDGRVLKVFQGLTYDPQEFIHFLQQGHTAATQTARR